MSVFFLGALFFTPGYAVWLLWGKEIKREVSILETIFLIILTGVLINSWLALLLAGISLFSLFNLLTIVVPVSIGFILLAVRRRLSLNPFSGLSVQPGHFAPLFLLGFLLFLSPRPSEYIVGGRDHGLYINSGIHIAQSGGIFVIDKVLAALPPESRAALIAPDVSITESGLPGPWSEGQRMAGMTIRNLERGVIVPHAFHLYPALIAIFYAVGGIGLALTVTQAVALMGAAGFYFTAQRLFGQPPALLALLLLVSNVVQVWFTKYPSAEILVQALLWSGLFAFSLTLSSGSKYTAVIAGCSFGLLHLTKLDTLFVPLILAAFFLLIWLRGEFSAAYRLFFASYGLMAIQATLYAFFVATIYTIDHLTRVLLPTRLADALAQAANGYTDPWQIASRLVAQNLFVITAALLTAALVFGLTRYLQEWLRRVAATRGPRLIQLIKPLTIILIGLFLFFNYLRPSQPIAFSFMDWYLSPFVVVLGIVGLCQAGLRHQGKYAIFIWLMIVGNALPLFVLGPGTALDHFWAVRRFLPAAIPMFILGSAYLLWRLATMTTEWRSAFALPLALTAVILVGFWGNTQPIARIVEYDGLVAQLNQLSQQFSPEAILLFDRSDASGRIATPLWLTYGHAAFLIQPASRESDGLAQAVAIWQNEGRDVYWFSSQGESPDVVGGRATHYVRTEVLHAPLVETPQQMVPRRVGRFVAVFDIYQVADAHGLPANRQVTTRSAAGIPQPIVGEGLYPVEPLAGVTPRQWSGDLVMVNLPAEASIETVSLIMGNGRPFDPPPEVTFFFNEAPLATVTVREAVELHTFSIPAHLSQANSNQLRLEITSWMPALTGHGADQRSLGVLLYQIKWTTP